MDRVVNSLLDPVVIFFLLGLAIGFVCSNLEMPRHLTIDWQSGVLLRRVPRSR